MFACDLVVVCGMVLTWWLYLPVTRWLFIASLFDGMLALLRKTSSVRFFCNRRISYFNRTTSKLTVFSVKATRSQIHVTNARQKVHVDGVPSAERSRRWGLPQHGTPVPVRET